MPKYVTLGRDTSGREIRMSPLFRRWWEEYVDELGFTPTITQGGWQSGEGARASAGTHEGDALDLRVWDRSVREVGRMVSEARDMGCAAWLRDRHHGGFSDPHIHLVPGPWAFAAPAAIRQWQSYVKGRDGLASNGADYHPRPDPLVTRWEVDMAYTDKDRTRDQDFIAQMKKRADRTLKFERAMLRYAASTDRDVESVKANIVKLLAEFNKD